MFNLQNRLVRQRFGLLSCFFSLKRCGKHDKHRREFTGGNQGYISAAFEEPLIQAFSGSLGAQQA